MGKIEGNSPAALEKIGEEIRKQGQGCQSGYNLDWNKDDEKLSMVSTDQKPKGQVVTEIAKEGFAHLN